MDDVNGIGNITEEFADASGETVGSLARSGYPDNQREERDSTQRVVDTVSPKVFRTADAGHGEQGYEICARF